MKVELLGSFSFCRKVVLAFDEKSSLVPSVKLSLSTCLAMSCQLPVNATPLRDSVVPESTEVQFDPLSVDLMMTPETELTPTKVLFPKETPILKIARVPKCRGAYWKPFFLKVRASNNHHSIIQ